ncbi:MAG: peptidase C45, partial [Chloroflexi bacterium]|nr:peptidase C45 [Chloroflexota bacterium]
VHTIDDDGFETLGFTEAGILGSKIGLNSGGLGLTINGLVSSVDDWSRWSLPFHARCFDILRARSFDAARAVVAEAPRACSANFLLAMPPESAVDIEAAPLSLRELHPRDSMLIHSNHFLDPARLGIEQPIVDPRPHSRWRQARMQTLLEARRPVSEGDLEAALRDHDNYPDSICRHENDVDPPEERYLTVTSVIMDLDERSMRLTDGPPCEHLYEAYSLPHTALLAASRDGQPITTGSN